MCPMWVYSSLHQSNNVWVILRDHEPHLAQEPFPTCPINLPTNYLHLISSLITCVTLAAPMYDPLMFVGSVRISSTHLKYILFKQGLYLLRALISNSKWIHGHRESDRKLISYEGAPSTASKILWLSTRITKQFPCSRKNTNKYCPEV